MKKSFCYNFLLLCILSGLKVNAQTTVSSLTQLITTLSKSNQNIKMAPGTYAINTTNIGHVSVDSNGSATIFTFSGSNNTYDFTGVKFEFDTKIFQAFGTNEVVELRTLGDNIVLKNLTMEDIGTIAPEKTALGIKFDGLRNTIDGFHLTIRGSYPYGYGDLFGKGSDRVINHKKHAAILVRGENNTIKNTTVIHRSYGHGIFCQGSKDALIENCYVEGEVRTTDDVLKEAGTGSPADKITIDGVSMPFQTTWGFKVPAGYMISLQEDGIRSYDTGPHYLTGVVTTTDNVTVRNCTVKRMRSAYPMVFADGIKIIENCKAIESETGFSIGSNGSIINCEADAKYGSAFVNAYSTDKNSTVSIKILNSDNRYGTHPVAYIGGTGHNITFTSEETTVDQTYPIQLAGDRNDLRMLNGANASQNNHSVSTVTVSNQTKFPVLLETACSKSTIKSCGLVTDKGTSNTISTATCPVALCLKTTANTEAECYDDMLGIQSETCSEGGLNIGYINDGDWAKYSGLNLSTMKSITARVASKTSGTIEVRLGSISGTLVGTIPVTSTGGNQNWVSNSTNITPTTGVQDVYLVFKGGTGYLFNINWFGFSKDVAIVTDIEDQTTNLETSIYPNPTSGIVMFSKQNKFTICNSLGEFLLKGDGVDVDLSLYPAGIYILRVGETTQKIIKY